MANKFRAIVRPNPGGLAVAGCLDNWQAKADELCRLGYDVQVSDALEKLATDDERRAGLDLADVLLREWPGYPPNWDE